MKMVLSLMMLVVALVAMSLSACQTGESDTTNGIDAANHIVTPGSTHASRSSLQRSWRLIAISGVSPIALQTESVGMRLERGGQYSADMGCNQIAGRYKASGDGDIIFSDMISTKMFCDDSSGELEDRFVMALPEMIRYQLDGERLQLLSPSGQTMSFVAD